MPMYYRKVALIARQTIGADPNDMNQWEVFQAPGGLMSDYLAFAEQLNDLSLLGGLMNPEFTQWYFELPTLAYGPTSYSKPVLFNGMSYVFIVEYHRGEA